jgi:hypothetical protein
MFKYTRAAILSVINEFKIWSIIFTWGLFAVTVGYNIFAIVMDIGYLWANIASLCIITISTAFELITKNKDIKIVKRVVKRVVSWLKILLKAAVLGLTIYGLYIASTDVNPLTIILTTLMIILWILTVLIEIITTVVISKKAMFEEAWKNDIDEFKKPIETVGNTVKKIFGKEVYEEPKEKSGIIKKLDKIIADRRE